MEREYFVHESSFVEEGAEIGAGTKIWHFCHVEAGARIGRGCVLGQNVYIGRNAVIGDFVKIQNNVSVYEGVTLEDGVFCGPSCVFYKRPHSRRAPSQGKRRKGEDAGAGGRVDRSERDDSLREHRGEAGACRGGSGGDA